MNDLFIATFSTTFISFLKIFLIVIASGIIVRKGIITDDQVKAVSTLTVRILLPCLIFSKVVSGFKPVDIPFWWMIPLGTIAFAITGLGITFLLFIGHIPAKKHIFPLASMQNAGYLVLPIAQALYPDKFDQVAVYIFLVVLGLNPTLWSVGKILVTSGTGTRISLKGLITPPLIASIGSICLVLLGLNVFFPPVILSSVNMMGEATVPIATFVLGATLGNISLRALPGFWDIVRIMGVKFVLIPVFAIFLLTINQLKLSHPILADVLVLESTSAPATAFILQIRTYGGDRQKIGGLILISYIICILAMPFWVAVWKSL